MARTTKTKSAQTVDFVEIPQPAAAPAEQLTLLERLRARAVISWQYVDTHKRHILAYITSFMIGYLGASIAMPIINALVILTAQITGSFFLTCVVYMLGIIAVGIGVVMASQKAGLYIIEGDIASDLSSLKSRVTGMFARRPLAAA